MDPFSVPILCRKYHQIVVFFCNINAVLDTSDLYARLHLLKLAFSFNNSEFLNAYSNQNLEIVYPTYMHCVF